MSQDRLRGVYEFLGTLPPQEISLAMGSAAIAPAYFPISRGDVGNGAELGGLRNDAGVPASPHQVEIGAFPQFATATEGDGQERARREQAEAEAQRLEEQRRRDAERQQAEGR